MSSDNFYAVVPHPKGGYTAVMCFSSDQTEPVAREGSRQFDDVAEAVHWAWQQEAEYGVSIHPELMGKFLQGDKRG